MSKAKVFVIMPFSDDFFESYELIKEHFQEEFEFSNAGDEDNQQNILADIISPIYNADIILADLTGLNPNVMYELGIAHSFNKKTIVITRDEISTLPFDLKQYRTKGYTTHFKQFHDLLSYLDKNFKGAVDGSVIFNNPVSDFLNKNQIDPQILFAKDKINIEIPDDEKGLIDFVAEIEEDVGELARGNESLIRETNKMNAGLEDCTSEIERVKKTAGDGLTSFIRKQAKKAADYMSTYSVQLRKQSDTINTLWTKVEKNIFGLLENKFIANEENKNVLVDFLKALRIFQNSIRTSNESLKSMKDANLNNLGLERSLNQSIHFLDSDLATYLSTSDQMYYSIDRILSKGKYIFGDIDYNQEDNPND